MPLTHHFVKNDGSRSSGIQGLGLTVHGDVDFLRSCEQCLGDAVAFIAKG